jgi:hypothetical protein
VLKPRLIYPLAAIFLLAMPGVGAQSSPVALAPSWPSALSATAATDIGFNVTLECAFLLGKGGSVNVDVGLNLPPVWLNGTPVRVPFSLTACTAGTTITKSGTLSVSASPKAPGLFPFDLTAQATVVGGTENAAHTRKDLVVAYRPGHAFTPSGNQTFEVVGATYGFDLRIDVNANAQTMVMFEDKTVEVGMLDGVRAMTFDVANGERSATYNVVFTPPATAWEESNVTIRTYSHCLVGSGCEPQLEQRIVWTFVNRQPAQIQGDSSGNMEPGAASPGPSLGAMLILGMLAVALARRHR